MIEKTLFPMNVYFRNEQELAAFIQQHARVAQDEREALIREMCEAMRPFSGRHNEWRGWPGTWAFANAALSVIERRAALSAATPLPEVYISGPYTVGKNAGRHSVCDFASGRTLGYLVDGALELACAATPPAAVTQYDSTGAMASAWFGTSAPAAVERVFAAAPQPAGTPPAVSAEARDAARYRWLRSRRGPDHINVSDGNNPLYMGRMDRAVDAAMGTPPAGEQK